MCTAEDLSERKQKVPLRLTTSTTVAITDSNGSITDTFAYDTYGKLISRTGTSFMIFGYNGRDGIVTDKNGLIYMRARYYSPELRRFVNADILSGEISNAVTLNRYAYANGNPVSNVDPFGLSVERGTKLFDILSADDLNRVKDIYDHIGSGLEATDITKEALYVYLKNGIKNAKKANNIGKGIWNKQIQADLKWLDDILGPTAKISKGMDIISLPWLDAISLGIDVGVGLYENLENGEGTQEIITDIVVDTGFGAAGVGLSTLGTYVVSAVVSGTALGTAVPGIGNVIGAVAGVVVGAVTYVLTEVVEFKGKTLVEWTDEGIDWIVDKVGDWFS